MEIWKTIILDEVELNHLQKAYQRLRDKTNIKFGFSWKQTGEKSVLDENLYKVTFTEWNTQGEIILLAVDSIIGWYSRHKTRTMSSFMPDLLNLRHKIVSKGEEMVID